MMNLDWDHAQLGEAGVLADFKKNVSPDPHFPQLANFYDPIALGRHLQKSLVNCDLRGFEGLEIVNVRYSVGKHFHVVYRIGQDSGAPKKLYLVIRYFPPGEDHHYFEKVLKRAKNARLCVHLTAWHAVAFLFPEDPSLPFLHKMFDWDALRVRWPALTGAQKDAAAVDWALMSYHPGVRTSIRYRAPGFSVIGKIEAQQETASLAHRSLLALWTLKNRSFGMARPLGIDAVSGIRWQAYVPGERVDVLARSAGWSPLVRIVAQGLAAFHKRDIPALRPYGLKEVISRMVRKRIPRVRNSLLPLADRIDRFSTRLLETASSLEANPLVMIHGDLNTSNILINKGKAVFLDLDLIAWGDRENDLAFFASRLILITVQSEEEIEDVMETIGVFLEAYATAAKTSILQRTFAWYLAAHLVGQQIKTCAGHRAPTLGRVAPVLLDYALKMLERCETLGEGVYTN